MRPSDPPPEMRSVLCRACGRRLTVGAEVVKQGRPIKCPDCGEVSAHEHNPKAYKFQPSARPSAGLKPNPWPIPAEGKEKPCS